MQQKNPDGYRNLLAYQKAQQLHDQVLELISHFPKSLYKQAYDVYGRLKTIADLADQMPRSARSTHKNIVEGWKRNTTKEYFEFLGFSIGSNSELKDDAADIVTGKYQELMGIKGIMGKMGNPVYPFNPLSPITLEQLDRLRFYPLDPALPPAVKIYLQAKEVDFLLYKLQRSLDLKMDSEHTKPSSQRFRENEIKDSQADAEFHKYLKQIGVPVFDPDKRMYVKRTDD